MAGAPKLCRDGYCNLVLEGWAGLAGARFPRLLNLSNHSESDGRVAHRVKRAWRGLTGNIVPCEPAISLRGMQRLAREAHTPCKPCQVQARLSEA